MKRDTGGDARATHGLVATEESHHLQHVYEINHKHDDEGDDVDLGPEFDVLARQHG